MGGGTHNLQQSRSELESLSTEGVFGPQAGSLQGGALEELTRILGVNRPADATPGGLLGFKAAELASLDPFSTGVGSAFQDELLNPTFGPQNDSETAIINNLMSLTGGGSAARGLGAPTQSSLAQVIAPTLVNQRQSRIGNLLSGVGAEQSQRNVALQSLLSLIGLQLPRISTGQNILSLGQAGSGHGGPGAEGEAPEGEST